MPRLLFVSLVCCVLCLGCGKSGEDDAAGNGPTRAGDPAAVNQGQGAATTNTGSTAGGATRGAPTSASSNPVTNFFTGLDRAAKRGGPGTAR